MGLHINSLHTKTLNNTEAMVSRTIPINNRNLSMPAMEEATTIVKQGHITMEIPINSTPLSMQTLQEHKAKVDNSSTLLFIHINHSTPKDTPIPLTILRISMRGLRKTLILLLTNKALLQNQLVSCLLY